MTRILVTHADEPIGRRVVKNLYHDPDVEVIFALGSGPPPLKFDAYLAGSDPQVTYTRLDLAKHRPVRDLFHSAPFRTAEIDTVVYVPRHGAGTSATAPLIGGLCERTAESRLLLQHCLETRTIGNLVAIGSAFVYRLPPGNANHLSEDSELNLDPNVIPEIRAWIDCDMIFHSEVHNDRLRVALLRVPTVVAAGGYVYLHPSLPGRPGARVRALGFDPICALVSDKDVARAVRAATKAPVSGIFNIAGGEAVPLSMLARWTGHWSIPVPGPLLGMLDVTERALGIESRLGAGGGEQLRYGFTLDTDRAAAELGFRSQYRIGLARAGDGALHLETASI
jgi:nucleoside-diphosphate-sugar epimerase